MTALRIELDRTTTTAVFTVTDAYVRKLADDSITLGGGFNYMFRPSEVTVTVNWSTGRTLVLLTGPGSGAVPGKALIALDNFADAADHDLHIVRDAVGHMVSEHEYGTI